MLKKLLKFFLLEDKPTISSNISNSTQNIDVHHFSNNSNTKIATNGSTIIDHSYNVNSSYYDDHARIKKEMHEKENELRKFEVLKKISSFILFFISLFLFSMEWIY